MTNNRQSLPETCDVAIIGGGPSGLACATRLKELGIDSVIVLEREPEAGGIPRHCGHPPFGMREFKRLMTGPTYAAALVRRALKAGVIIRTNATVTHLHEGGKLSLSTLNGEVEVSAKKVVLSTGVRETPRAPRFVSGQRPLGISTTGALQSMVYLKDKIPFKRPVIVGSELVTFSSLLTCRKAKIKPALMIETNNRITARSPCKFLPMLFGVPLRLNTQLVEIIGKTRVEGVRIKTASGAEQVIDCDGVLFTGQFTPESTLMRMGHLEVDQRTGGPVIDQFGRCSDPAYFATGNLLRPVENAGWCWNEGVQTATWVAESLSENLNQNSKVNITLKNPKLKYVVPQVLAKTSSGEGGDHLQLRFATAATGKLSLCHNGKTLWSKSGSFLPERRILLPMPNTGKDMTEIEVHFMEDSI